MSRKIRLTGYLLVAVILIVGLVLIGSVSGKKVGPVKSLSVVKVGEKSADLSWKKVGSADGYFIYQKQGDKYKKIDKVADSSKTNYRVKNLADSTEYTFYVNAFKTTKKNTFESKKHTDVFAFTKPEKQAVRIDNIQEGALKILWNENKKCSGYDIEYGKKNDFSDAKSIEIKDSKASETDVMELSIGDEYNVRVRSYSIYNEQRVNGKWSDAVVGKVLDNAGIELQNSKKPMVAFTFDDGPGYNDASDRIMDVIEKYNIKATFFMLGTNSKSHTKNVQRKVADGCQIGNHTYNHENYGKNVTAQDIIKASDAIEKAGGVRPTAFRSPGGITTDLIRNTCKGENMPLYYWSLDTEDWKSRDADKIYKKVMRNVSDGDIILMHEIYGTTADAFERLVPELLDKGYVFVTCDELVKAKTGKAPEPGTQYVNGKTIKNQTS